MEVDQFLQNHFKERRCNEKIKNLSKSNFFGPYCLKIFQKGSSTLYADDDTDT